MSLKFGLSLPQGWTMELAHIRDPVEAYETRRLDNVLFLAYYRTNRPTNGHISSSFSALMPSSPIACGRLGKRHTGNRLPECERTEDSETK